MPSVVISKASTGSSLLVTGVAGKAINVDSYVFTSADANVVTFLSASTAKTGAMSTGGAGGGVSAPDGAGSLFNCAAGENLNITCSAANQVSGHLNYHFKIPAPAALAAVTLRVTPPAYVTAGTAFNVTVTALDITGQKVTGYTGTVAITSSDSAGTMPSNATLTSGVGVFAITMLTARSQSIIATDTVTATITGRDLTHVYPAAIATLTTTAASTTTAGDALSVVVEAKDTHGNRATSYPGSVTFTSTDTEADLPANSTLHAGLRTFTAILYTAGTKTITATDTVTGAITDATSNITVAVDTVHHYTVGIENEETIAGADNDVTVTAKDEWGNTVTTHTGTVALSSTDGAFTNVTGSGTLTSGVRVFTTKLFTVGTHSVTADRVTTVVASMLTGTVTGIDVIPAAIHHFTMGGPETEVAGVEFDFTISAVDEWENLIEDYAGTVTFAVSETDSGATLPSDSTLTDGVGTFQATLEVAQANTVTAEDTVTGTIVGEHSITIEAAAPDHLVITDPGTGTTSVSISIGVEAVDEFDNLTPDATGTITFVGSTPAELIAPGPTPFYGSGAYDVIFEDDGTHTLTITVTGLTPSEPEFVISDP